jgi:hypothetical protein
MLQLLVTANVPSLLILLTLMMEAILPFDISVLTRGTRCHITQDGILYTRHTHLTVSNMVTRERSVVTRRTILPGTMSGITTKLPQDIMTNSELGK